MSRYYRSKDIANIDEFNPGQEYYVVGAHWGAVPPASKVGEKEATVWLTLMAGGIWNSGLSGSDKVRSSAPCGWTIHHVDDGYNIKSVEHGSYLGFHHTEISGASDPSAGLTASKEPFAWTVEPQNKGDGVFRFTVPNTDVHIDFSSVASVNETTSADKPTEADESDEAAFAREMAAAGHNFDPNFKVVGDLNFADQTITTGDNAQVGGGSEGNGAEEGAGPQLHAFGRSRFPPGYFGK
ncbi:hypothetical protein EV714DRAFT_221057 [Schizophyllum commune]